MWLLYSLWIQLIVNGSLQVLRCLRNKLILVYIFKRYLYSLYVMQFYKTGPKFSQIEHLIELWASMSQWVEGWYLSFLYMLWFQGEPGRDGTGLQGPPGPPGPPGQIIYQTSGNVSNMQNYNNNTVSVLQFESGNFFQTEI